MKNIPGLVDLQVNGYQGVGFSDESLTEENFVKVCRAVLRAGTTAFLPTMITSPEHIYERNLKIMAKVIRQKEFNGRLLGVHLEGPFISANAGARGAHNNQWIRKPDTNYLDQLLAWSDGTIKLITIAAETEEADQLTRYAAANGVVVSLGHQVAGHKDLQRLVLAGAKALTHLGNGTAAMLDRHHNPIWAGLAEDGLVAMIITDGHHLPDTVIKTIVRTKGVGRCIVVSDMAPLAGMKPGKYKTLGNEVVLEENGKLYNPKAGHLVGSSATMVECMNHLASLKLVSCDELIAIAFYNPLKLIDVDTRYIAGEVNINFDEKLGKFVWKK